MKMKKSVFVDRLIPKNATIEALELLGDNHNFIGIWIKLLEENYEVRYGMYNKSMKQMNKQIPTTMIKSLSPEQKVQKLMTQIGGGWYIENISKGLPPLKRTKK